MWSVHLVTGAPGKPASIRVHKFETKRQALAFIRTVSHSYIKRIDHTYTIYPRGGK